MTETGGNTALASTLGALAAVSLVVGLYAFIWPRSFYDHMLGVDRLPPYSHLLADVGGFYLGFAVLFAWAAVDRSRALVLATCAAWVEVQSLHLAYHVTHLEHFNVSTAVAQTVLLSAAPAVAVAAGLLGARASGTARAGATSAIRRWRVPEEMGLAARRCGCRAALVLGGEENGMGRWWRGQALVVARWRATGLRLRGRPPTPRSRARSRAPDGYRRSGERRPDTRAASKGALSAGARGSARVLLRSHVMAEWHARETAEQWDAHAGDRLPTRAEQQDVLLALLGAAEIGDGAVLDLGVGSGLVAEAVLVTLPKARLVGLDLSGAMLKLARERLGRFDARVELMQGDLASVDRIELPDLPYRAAFSVQTMHHLADAEKAAAIAWTANVVEPGGLIVIIDRVRVSERLFHDWAVLWRRIDSDTPATYAEHVAALTRAGDRPALLQDQLRWLQNVGLEASCLHLYGNRAVLVARRPAWIDA